MTTGFATDRMLPPKRWARKHLFALLASILGVAAAVMGAWFHEGGDSLRIGSGALTISVVTEGEFQEFIPVVGIVTPLQTFPLTAIQGGIVSEKYRDEGEIVHAGDSILRLDNTDLRLDIMYREAQLYEQINNLRNTRLAMEQHSLQLRSDLLDVELQIEQTERQYKQAMSLGDDGLISQNEVDQAKEKFDYWTRKRALTIESQRQDSLLRRAQIDQLEGSVERMESNLEFVRMKLEDLVIRTPIAGQLTSLNADVGISVSHGQKLGQIDQLDGFKLEAELDEFYVSRISKGLDGVVLVGEKSFPLRVAKVYPQIVNGRFKIDLEFTGPMPNDLRRGQSLTARVVLGDSYRAVLLPRGEFYNETGGRWVFVLRDGGREAERQPVEIGRQNSQVYEVLAGLKPGDSVVTSSYLAMEKYSKLVLTR